jgi:predicted metal-dependent peptidase
MKKAFDISTIKVGGLNYAVKVVKDLHHPMDTDVKLDGIIQFHSTSISLDSAQNEQATILALVHEIVHAMYIHIGKSDHDESDVDAMAYQLIGVVKDNPELFKKIMRLK